MLRKNLNITSFLATVFLLVISCSTAKKSQAPFFFIQMSDPQFGMFTANKSFDQETVNFTKAINEANRLKPAFVVVTGDLVNKTFDTAQIAEYKRILSGLNKNIPVYNVAGNHDVGNTPSPADIEKYREAFGPEYYSFTNRSVFGIVLNSIYLHSPQNVPVQAQQQFEWLEKTLEEANQKNYQHIFIFLHHPLFLKEADEPDQYFNIPTPTRKKYLDLFVKHGVKYIFAGHYHRNAFGTAGNLQMITTGPVGMPLGPDPSGLQIVTVNGANVSHQYYGLDSIPLKVAP